MSPPLSVGDVGFPAVSSSEVSLGHAQKLAATLDDDVRLEQDGELPLLWHWAFFTPTVPSADLGHDGHPSMAASGPTADLPRRMWAGGRISSRTPLLIGREATRRSRVASAARKSGRSGELLVVTVEHRIEQDGRLAVVEEQDLVYREAATDRVALPVAAAPVVPPAGSWAEVVTLDPVRLFRFSALTFNSHRIHYDRPYATSEEGYPELVVHGPLTAILLAGAAGRRGAEGGEFAFRAMAPLFAGAHVTIVGHHQDGGVSLEAVRVDQTVAMTATRTDRRAASSP